VRCGKGWLRGWPFLLPAPQSKTVPETDLIPAPICRWRSLDIDVASNANADATVALARRLDVNAAAHDGGAAAFAAGHLKVKAQNKGPSTTD
jgi:hypothetical protein